MRRRRRFGVLDFSRCGLFESRVSIAGRGFRLSGGRGLRGRLVRADRLGAPSLAIADSNVGSRNLAGLLPSPNGFPCDSVAGGEIATPKDALRARIGLVAHRGVSP